MTQLINTRSAFRGFGKYALITLGGALALVLHVAAKGLYRTKDQHIALALNFTNLALDGISAMLPMPVPGAILREPLSGTIRLDMGKFFSVKATEFDLNGDALSLAGEAHMDAKLLSLDVQGTVAKSSLLALAGGWPSGLGPELDIWLAGDTHEGNTIALALKGSVHRFDHTLALSGQIGSPGTPFTVAGLSDSPMVYIPAEL